MCSDKLRVAGTSDLIAKYNGVLSIIDYKTKRKQQIERHVTDYFIQTTCYAHMFEEITGQKINQIVILVSNEQNTRHEFIKSCDDYTEDMKKRIEKFQINNFL